jgi:hypothetical protein
MTSLEQIVLPLAESRALVEAGVVLETVFQWTRGIDRPIPNYTVWTHEGESLAPAPVLSELLDAIRAKHLDVNFEIYDTPHGERKIQAWMNDDVDEVETEGTTDLLAAAALLMEVSK